jgi:hypothetical protein
VDLRTNLDATLWKNAPMNLYDKSVARKYIGKEGVKELERLDEQKEKNTSFKGITVFNLKTRVGLLVTSLAKKDYFTIVDNNWDAHRERLSKIIEDRKKRGMWFT